MSKIEYVDTSTEEGARKIYDSGKWFALSSKYPNVLLFHPMRGVSTDEPHPYVEVLYGQDGIAQLTRFKDEISERLLEVCQSTYVIYHPHHIICFASKADAMLCKLIFSPTNIDIQS